jgi:hypothetical protein
MWRACRGTNQQLNQIIQCSRRTRHWLHPGESGGRYRTSMIDQARGLRPQSDLRRLQLPGRCPVGHERIAADWPGRLPTEQQIEQALKRGRFMVHGLPFTTHTGYWSHQTSHRLVSPQRSRTVVSRLPRAKVTDNRAIRGHADFIATRGDRVSAFGLRPQPAHRRSVCSGGRPGWSALTMRRRRWHRSHAARVAVRLGWPYPSDNHGPPSRKVSVAGGSQVKLPGIRVHRPPLDFAATIWPRTPVPTVRGDMPDSWIHGPCAT